MITPPEGWISISSTQSFGPEPGLKFAFDSMLPSGLSRAIWLRLTELTLEKLPPIKISPLLYTAIARIVLPTIFGLNVASSEPSAFSLARRVRGVPFTLVMLPPIRIFPSGCWRTTSTVPCTPVPGLNVKSSVLTCACRPGAHASASRRGRTHVSVRVIIG